MRRSDGIEANERNKTPCRGAAGAGNGAGDDPGDGENGGGGDRRRL